MFLKVIYIMLLVCLTNAGNTQRSLETIPKDLAHKQGCYVKEIKDVIPFLTSAAPVGSCKRINCFSDKLTVDTCEQAVTNDPKCFTTEKDYSRPYPQCCPTVECDLEVAQI